MKKFLLVMFVCLFTFSPVFAGESCCKSEPSFWKKIGNVGEKTGRFYEGIGRAPNNTGEAAATAFVIGLFTEPVTTLTITGVVVGGIVLWGVGNAIVDAVSE